MVPNGWNILTVGELFNVQLGKMLNKVAKEKHPQYEYLGNSDVRWGYFETNNLKTMYFSEKEKEKFKLTSGDILLCEGGEVGRCAIWTHEGKDVYYQKALHRLRENGNILPSYFQSYMTFINGTKLLDDFTTRTSIAHLTREKLLKLPVKVPPMKEQHKIAKILSTWDKAISSTERLIENGEQQKKALMQQLFTGKTRLLDDSGKPFDEEWKGNYLHDVAQIIVSPVDKKTVEGEIPVELCNYTDVYYNTRITKSRDFMKATAKQSEIDKYTLHVNDVIITKDSETPGDIAIPSLVSEDLDGVVCGYHLAIIRPNRNIVEGAYLNYLFSMPKTRYYFFTLATGATRFGLSVSGINKAYFTLPPLYEQQKIASVLANADKELDLLEQQLAGLKQEKKALMQQLLTGKRRVKVDDKEAA